MSFFECDIVKAEKADAMRKYKRDQTCRFCLRVVGALILLFCSFTYIPVVEEMASAYLSLFNHQFPVFLIVNFLVVLIYHLSTTTVTNSAAAAIQPDLYNQYVSFSFSSRQQTSADEEKQLVVSPASEFQSADETTVSDKQLTRCENVYTPMESNPVRELAVTETYIEEKKTFRRTRSERYTVEKKRRSGRRELQRSETDNGREMVVAGGYTPARKSIQDLNNEEFRNTIESFIASKKKILREENFAVLTEEKEESFTAITYK